jgi:hypothetical protein
MKPGDHRGPGITGRILQAVSSEHGPTPDYPDVAPLYPRYFAGGLPPEHSPREIEQIAEERSRQDEALQGRKKPSFWKRLLGHDT